MPSNLRYAFLDSDFKFPFIVNSALPSDNVDALCDKLNSHKNAKICMHRILLEDNAKPSIEGQR